MKKIMVFLLVLFGITILLAQSGNPPQRLLCYSDDFTIHLNWDAPISTQGLTAYKIYRNEQLISTSSNLQTYYEDSNFEMSNSYFYTITAVYTNPDTESVPSDNVEIIPAYDASNNPMGLTFNKVKRDVKLFWSVFDNIFYQDNFDDVTITNRWTLIDEDGDGHPWHITKESPSLDNHCMKSNGVVNDQALNPKDWLITPRLIMSNYVQGFVFRVKATNSKLKIYYSNNNTNLESFILKDSIDVTGNEWIYYEQYFTETDNDLKYIALLHEGSNTSDLMIDEFNLIAITSANQDRSLLGFNIYQNGSQVNEELIAPENRSYTLFNLENGDYQFEVKAVNEGGLQGSSLTNVTISDPIYNNSYPYFVDFESGAIPSDWDLFNNDDQFFNWNISSDPGMAHNGSKGLVTYSWFFDEGFGFYHLNPDDYFISPIMDLPINTHALMLSYCIKSIDGTLSANYQLVLYESPYGINNVYALINDSVGTADWGYREINLSNLINEPVAVGWRFNDTAVYGIGLDDIRFTIVNSNDKPESAMFETKLQSNYPNPFNPRTMINYSLKSKAFVSIDIYNVKGQKVQNLFKEMQLAGNHQVNWDGRDHNQKSCASGIYFCRMTVSGQSHLMKMMLIK